MAKSTPGTSASKGSAQTVPNKRFRPLPIFNAQPRPPMNQFYGSGASNFYRRPNYSYGVPTGLGALLSGQQSPFGRMVDPATGFARRSFPRPVMGRQDFGRIGRGKTGVGGARTVNPGSQAVVDEYNRNPDPTLGTSLPPPTYGTVTGLPSGLTVEQARLRQEELASRRGGGFSRLAPDPYGTQSFKIDPDILDRGTVYRPPNQISSDRPMMLENPMLFANNPPPPPPPSIAPPSSPIIPDVRQQIEREIQMERAGVRPNVRPAPAPVIVPKPAPVVAAPTSPSDVQQQIMRQIQMEQAGVRPNVRPTMNVGKATGGPVGIHSGIASLVGRR